MINFFSEYPGLEAPVDNFIFSWLQKVLIQENKELQSLNIIFYTDEKLFELNKNYLGHDYYTDIITFQYEEDPIDGELYISVDRIKENASVLNIPFTKELNRIIVHGLLHLMGYNDKNEEEKQIMRDKEDHYLSLL